MRTRGTILWGLAGGFCALLLGAYFYSNKPQQNPILNAGGSATGNALELALQTTNPPFSFDSLRTLFKPDPIVAQVIIPLQKSRNTSPEQLIDAWIKAHGIKPHRILQISPTGDNLRAEIGINGPAFQDLSAIPGGLKDNDLLLYREGIYIHSIQFPQAKVDSLRKMSLFILSWPNERARIAIPGTASASLTPNWRIYGIEWK